jgi:hypothetical protein
VKKYQADLVAVLTTEQKQQWERMQGQPFEFPKNLSSGTELILVPQVHRELGMPDADAAKLVKSLMDLRRQMHENLDRNRIKEDTNRPLGDRIKEFNLINDTIRSSLTPAQWNRLQELCLQRQGVRSLNHSAVATTLGFTPEQRKRVRNLRHPSRGDGSAQPIIAEDGSTRQAKMKADLLDVLTPEQKQRWEAMQGKAFQFPRLIGVRIPAE